jgi:hypothetical protein
MKRTAIAILCILVSASLSAAPGKKPPPATANSQLTASDPVVDFKALVVTASEPKEWIKVRQHSKTRKWSKQYYTLGQVKFDVKKTDSLVSPAVGLVNFPIEVKRSEFFDTEQEAAQSTSLSDQRMTFYYSGKYLLNDGAWQTDQFSYYASFGDNPPDLTTATLSRGKLVRDYEAGTGEAQLLGKWIR